LVCINGSPPQRNSFDRTAAVERRDVLDDLDVEFGLLAFGAEVAEEALLVPLVAVGAAQVAAVGGWRLTSCGTGAAYAGFVEPHRAGPATGWPRCA